MKHPLSQSLYKDWSLLFSNFDDTLSIPYIIFLGEILKCFTAEEVKFSGYKRTNTGIGEECWNLLSGNACIYREKFTELSESWQRVEVLSNRTEILDLGQGNSILWDGEYNAFGGMKVTISGVSEKEINILRKKANDLFDEVNFSITNPHS